MRGKLQYILKISPLKIRGKDEYILIFPGRKMSRGKNEYVTPVLKEKQTLQYHALWRLL
jgi:hypothetical protein